MRPKVRYLESALESQRITPTNAKAVRRPLAMSACEMMDMRSPMSFRSAGFSRLNLVHGFERAAHAAYQCHGRKTDDERTDGGGNHNGSAFEGRGHILLRRHGNDDGNIKCAPESHALIH